MVGIVLSDALLSGGHSLRSAQLVQETLDALRRLQNVPSPSLVSGSWFYDPYPPAVDFVSAHFVEDHAWSSMTRLLLLATVP